MYMRFRPGIPSLRHCSKTIRPAHRSLQTLAIETSCDDTSVAVLEKLPTLDGSPTRAVLQFHKKVTSNNTVYHGVHPLASLYSHQENLARLVQEAIATTKCKPDFISVTRGPGMRSNLFTGLDTAKGLAVAWQIPLVGVHHMQAHALTPRLVKALERPSEVEGIAEDRLHDSNRPGINVKPEFPFLSVLASGGHTLLIRSSSLTKHEMLATTKDIAVGECLDKAARVILPPEILQQAKSTMYGALLEEFAFPNLSNTPPETQTDCFDYKLEDNTAEGFIAHYRNRGYEYKVPRNHEEATKGNKTKWGWGFNEPLSKATGGLKSKSLEMSFSGLMTAVERAVRLCKDPDSGRFVIERSPDDMTLEERRHMAREVMRSAFEHVASRVVLGLQHATRDSPATCPINTIVVSGGVAANAFFRYILASVLTAKAYSNVRIVFPPASLCTDNAAMIAWTGLEMYDAGYIDQLSIRALRKWPLDNLLTQPNED